MCAIALSELSMLSRNRVVAFSALLVPHVFGAFFVYRGGTMAGGGGAVAPIQVIMMSVMGVYVTATTTLAARRKTLFLKRLRSGTASDASVMTGLVAPIIAVNVVQVVVVLACLAVAVDAPALPAAVTLGVVLTQLLFAALAFATAGVTSSPEHAQYTTLPVFLVAVGVSVWVSATGLTDYTWLKLALPGGGVGHIVSAGWSGDWGVEATASVGLSLAWVVVAAGLAWRMFRWEPRR
ncbi:ABC transporter permease [Micrococcales bacterium 31B]|nr:ABC transporter permease [Micrococcales bacterium 31B]